MPKPKSTPTTNATVTPAAAKPGKRGVVRGGQRNTSTPATITIDHPAPDDAAAGRSLTIITIPPHATVATFDGGWIHVWDGAREVRVGPFSAEQAQQLSDDLGYDAVVSE